LDAGASYTSPATKDAKVSIHATGIRKRKYPDG
jgi:hypothetical protein